MQTIYNPEIYLYYIDNDGGRWSLNSLCKGEGVIDIEHLEPNGFYEAPGGISIFKDRIYCFLDTSAAGDLVSYVYFLFYSLVGLWKGDIPDELDFFKLESQPQAIANVIAKVHNLDRSILLLKSGSEGVVLDFLDEQGNTPVLRGSLYFQDEIVINSEAWIKAALLALTEYFSVAQSRYDDQVPGEDGGDSHLGRLIETWRILIGLYSNPHS